MRNICIGALCHTPGRRPDLRIALRIALLKLLGAHKPVSLYVESGILPSTGFFTELYWRLSHKVLPEAIGPRIPERCLRADLYPP